MTLTELSDVLRPHRTSDARWGAVWLEVREVPQDKELADLWERHEWARREVSKLDKELVGLLTARRDKLRAETPKAVKAREAKERIIEKIALAADEREAFFAKFPESRSESVG